MSAAVKYRDMTDAQQLAWGEAESTARIADLANVKSAEDLKAAQDAAVARRRLIGASRNQAAGMVIRSNRETRSRS